MELQELWRVIRKRWVLIVVITLVATLTSGVLSKFVIAKKYAATATLMAGAPSTAATASLFTQQLVTDQSLVATYATLATSQTVLTQTIDGLHLGLTPLELSGMVKAVPTTNTDLLTVTVTNTSSLWATRVANRIARNTIRLVDHVAGPKALNTVSPAVPSSLPVSPKTKENVAIAFVLGLLVSGGLAFLMEYLDDSIKTEDDITRVLGLPVLGMIPFVDSSPDKDAPVNAKAQKAAARRTSNMVPRRTERRM